MKTKTLLLVTSAFVTMAITHGTAYANPLTAADAPAAADASPAADAPQQSTPSTPRSDNSTSVGEVIVTVNKRAENVEDVPVAVTAFTPEQRDLQGVVSIFDFTRASPSFEYSSTLDRAYIRGVGRNTNAPGTQSGVALYVDGVYSSSTYALDRPEILSGNFELDAGPQGTLFGRNSIGGVIQQNTAHPNHDVWEVQYDSKVGDHVRLDQAVSWGGPINDKFALLLGYDYRKQYDGYFHNSYLDVDQGGPTNEHMYVGVLDYNLTPKWDGFIKFESTGFQRQLSGFSQYGDAPGYLAPANLDTVTSIGGLQISPFINCSAAINTQPGACAASNPTAAQATTYYNPANPQATNPYHLIQDTMTTANSHNNWDAVIQNNWQLPWFNLKYIGGYNQYIYNNLSDQDNTARGQFTYEPGGPTGVATGAAPSVTINPVVAQYYENRKWSTHELDFSNNDKGNFNWTTGLYYYRDNFNNIVDDYSTGQTELSTTPGVNNPGNNYYKYYYDTKTESEAIFGQVDWKFAPKWTLTLGARYNRDEEHSYEQDHYFAFLPAATGGVATNYNAALGHYNASDFTAFSIPATCAPTGVAPIASTGAKCQIAPNNTRLIQDSWDGWGGKAELSYKPTDDSLAYISYNRGYKAGAIVSSAMANQPILAPEAMNAYEAGYKFSPGRTLTINGDVYYYDYRNYQDFGSVPNALAPSGSSTIGFNIPKSRNYGVELTANWHPVHWLTLSGSADYLNAKVADGGNVAIVDPLDPGATGSYTLTRTDGSTQTITYKPKPCGATPVIVGGILNVPQCITGDALKGSAPWKIWLNADFRKDFNKGSLDIIPSFSWREGNVSGYFSDPIYNAPSYSEIDMRFVWTAASSKYKLIAFINNMANTQGYEYVYYAKDATRNTYYPDQQLTIPRTFGIEIQGKF